MQRKNTTSLQSLGVLLRESSLLPHWAAMGWEPHPSQGIQLATLRKIKIAMEEVWHNQTAATGAEKVMKKHIRA